MLMDVAEIKNTVMELYVGFLGRAADQNGFAYWVDEIHSGKLTFDNLRASFATPDQPEYWDIYGSLSNEQLATKVYQNLLNREPDAAGLAYWIDELDSGKIEPGHFINAIINAVKDKPNEANAGRLLDIDTLQNKVQAANYFTQESQTADPDSSAFFTAAKAAVTPVSSDAATVASSQAQTDSDLSALPKESTGVKGTAGDDILKSSVEGDWFIPGDGNDTIIGPSTYASVDYSTASAAVTVNLVESTATGESLNDTFTGIIDGITGSQFNDTLIGGNTATDEHEGFNGGAGDDTIQGGSGYDSLDYHGYNPSNAVVVNFATGIAQDNYGGTDTFSGIEATRGTYFADTFIGGDQTFASFRGLAGNDSFQGAVYNSESDTGWERVDYSKDYKRKDENGEKGEQGVNVDLSQQTATDGFGDTDTLINIDQVRGTQYNDIFKGDDNNNRFDGREGNDTFIFSGDWGRDRVSDFTVGEDKLDLSQTSLTFDDLTMSYLADSNELRVISGDNMIRLSGVESVQSSDFIFA